MKISRMYINIQNYFKCFYKTIFIYCCLLFGRIHCIFDKKGSDDIYLDECNNELLKNPDYIDEYDILPFIDINKCFYCKNIIKSFKKTYRYHDKSYCSEFCRNSSCDLSVYVDK